MWLSSPVPPCCRTVWCVTGLPLATSLFLLSAEAGISAAYVLPSGLQDCGCRLVMAPRLDDYVACGWFNACFSLYDRPRDIQSSASLLMTDTWAWRCYADLKKISWQKAAFGGQHCHCHNISALLKMDGIVAGTVTALLKVAALSLPQ